MYLKRLIQLYRRICKDFLESTTLHGFRVLLRQTPQRYGKKFWLVFLTTTILWTHYFVINLLVEFLGQPTEIHLSPYLIHISNTPFPCIAICSGNKISKKKLNALAEDVFQHQQQYFPNLLAANAYEMSQHLLLLGSLYLFPHQEVEVDDNELLKLHSLLQSMYNTTDYPTREILRDIAPDCMSLVQRGFLFGSPANVSRIFHARMTRFGVCCMFNYRRPSASDDSIIKFNTEKYVMEAREMRFESSSSLNGLHFVLENDPDDYAFPQFSNDAFQLYMFPPDEYAMPTSSTKGHIFVDRGSIFDIPIQPLNFHASPGTRTFPPEKRKCYFQDEGRKFLNNSYYSMDECILICEMRSMVKYCGCVAPSLSPLLINADICTLTDLPCLQKWKRKWIDWDYFDYVYTNEMNAANIVNDKLAICQSCYPACDGVGYKLFPNVLPLRRQYSETYSLGLLKGKSGDKNLAIVKLFFQSLFEPETEEDIVGDWVVFLNRFGGILSLIFGFGIISYIEVLYFYTGKWGVLIYRAMMSLRKQPKPDKLVKTEVKATEVPNDDQRLDDATYYSLYWQELRPQRLMRENYLMQKYKWHTNKKGIQCNLD